MDRNGMDEWTRKGWMDVGWLIRFVEKCQRLSETQYIIIIVPACQLALILFDYQKTL